VRPRGNEAVGQLDNGTLGTSPPRSRTVGQWASKAVGHLGRGPARQWVNGTLNNSCGTERLGRGAAGSYA
jgi:hypothetical protein